MEAENIFMQQNNKQTIVVAQNININMPSSNQSSSNEEFEEESELANLIFSEKRFHTHASMILLRNTIASAILMSPEQTELFGGFAKDSAKIDPIMKNEWFFLFAAISDANILKRKHTKDTDFIKQMVHFFPNLFELNYNETGEFEKGIRRYVDSISRERSKWKIKGEVVKVYNLKQSKYLLKQLKSDKVERIYNIAFPLYQKLQQISNL